MTEILVMSEQDEKIIRTFGKVIPKLTEGQKSYLLGLGEGMSMLKSRNEPHSIIVDRSFAQNEQIKIIIELNKRFSELSEQGQIMILTYLSALHDKELADNVALAAEQSKERKS